MNLLDYPYKVLHLLDDIAVTYADDLRSLHPTRNTLIVGLSAVKNFRMSSMPLRPPISRSRGS